ncbi:MAG: MtnX-like HAD-IB family phosphatase [Thermodesulfobacteriota bacterium]
MSNKNLALTFNYANIELCEQYAREEMTEPIGKGDVIFCDFDGTITIEDVVDKLLTLYADEHWKEIEKLWEQRKIGSEECLKMQLRCIERIRESELFRFAFDIEIDPRFPDFLNSVRKKGIDFYIVSDGFDWLIKIILLNNGIPTLPVFANHLKIKNYVPVPSFPFKTRECYMKSGMCKCSIINTYKRERTVTYIGDGESDICAVRKADIVFAKNRLSDYCRRNAIDFIEFSDFDDITKVLLNKEKRNADR